MCRTLPGPKQLQGQRPPMTLLGCASHGVGNESRGVEQRDRCPAGAVQTGPERKNGLPISFETWLFGHASPSSRQPTRTGAKALGIWPNLTRHTKSLLRV